MELFAGHSDFKVISNPAWHRARIAAIEKLLEEVPQSQEKNAARVLLRNGMISKELKKRFDQLQDQEYKLTFALNSPLSFREITSFNTWFAMHPEKICGKETITTSLQFPITVKGSKEDIIQAIHQDIEEGSQEDESDDEPGSVANRFGDAHKLLDWPVSEFNSYYQDELVKFNQENKPLDEHIESLEQQILDAGRDRTKRKELLTKFTNDSQKRSLLWKGFEEDWLNFCTGLRNIILEKARQSGITIEDEDDFNISDEILSAISERPGIEQYWNTLIGDVIDTELEYFKNISGKQNPPQNSYLELEALALEVELQLLKT